MSSLHASFTHASSTNVTRSLAFILSASFMFGSAACAASGTSDGLPAVHLDSGDGAVGEGGDSGADPDATTDSGGLSGDVIPGDIGPTGTSVIYASTDTELWSMDPATKVVSKIGAFVLPAGSTGSITDVAVNGDNKVWVNGESAVFEAALPVGGTGPVNLTLRLTLPAGSKFYALGFAPAGVLETGEGLVAGDSLGELYYIPASSPTPTLQKLGSFGPCLATDPLPCKTGMVWELSGDVVFYSKDGTPRGLATLRACLPGGGCKNTNDVVAEIDMAALATKSATAKLRKSILGAGTGHGKLFGVGAWDDKVYAFSFADKSVTPPIPAQLISIDGTGVGTVLQKFDTLVGGWSGAGVTTKAKVSIIK